MRRRRDSVTIAVTMGDPCGIGPEVTLKALRRLRAPPHVRLAVIGDSSVLGRAARRLRLGADPLRGQTPWFVDVRSRGAFTPGRTSRAAGRAALAYLDGALRLWRAGRIQGLVTAPVTKWAIALERPDFVGQTEYLASASGRLRRDVVMLFVSDRLRVALVTRHVPLARVSRALTVSRLRATIRMLHEALHRQFGIRRPTLVLCGLNPHAGEAGRCGREELRIMRPVLARLRAEGIACDGPFAADGLFAGGVAAYDAVVCPYHDQGLIPFKLVSRDEGCQVSLGLPFVRTSPDHGSALDLAGQGLANPGSMLYALRLAIQLTTDKTVARWRSGEVAK